MTDWWPTTFNGNANDASGNGNHGTVHGATLTTDRFGNPISAEVNMLKRIVFIAAILTFVLAASMASADTVLLAEIGVTDGSGGGSTLVNIYAGPLGQMDAYAGVYNVNVKLDDSAPATLISGYCVEPCYSSSSYQPYELLPIADNSGYKAAAWVLSQGYTGPTAAAAQVAVWELTWDYQFNRSYDLAAGEFRYNSGLSAGQLADVKTIYDTALAAMPGFNASAYRIAHNPVGSTGWVEYQDYVVRYTTPQVEVANKIYGIFIGSEHVNQFQPGVIFRGDLGAEKVSNAFRNLPNYVYDESILLTTKMADGGVKRSDVLEAISYLKNNVLKPGDGLVFYVNCHGVELTQDLLPPIYALSIGVEGPISIDKINQFPNDYITDSNLKEMLSGMDDIQKWVFIDSCHSGGFYNSIHSLTNASLIASTTADLLAWGYDFSPGMVKGGLFTGAICDGFSRKNNGKLLMDGYHSTLHPEIVNPEDGIVTFEEIVNYIEDYNQKTDVNGKIVYELNIGDTTIFTPDMWTPTGFRTADFVGGFSTNRKDISPILYLLLD